MTRKPAPTSFALLLSLACAGMCACEETPQPATPEPSQNRRPASIERSGVTGCTPTDQPPEEGLLVSYEHRFEGPGGEHWKLLVKPDGEMSLFEWETAEHSPDGSVQAVCRPDATPKTSRAEAAMLDKLKEALKNPRLKNLDSRYIGPPSAEYAVFRLTIYAGDDKQSIDAGPVDWSNLPKELGDVVDALRALRTKISPEG